MARKLDIVWDSRPAARRAGPNYPNFLTIEMAEVSVLESPLILLRGSGGYDVPGLTLSGRCVGSFAALLFQA